MKLEVVSYDSDEGIITLEMDHSAKEHLIERGFNSLLKDSLTKMEEENDG